MTLKPNDVDAAGPRDTSAIGQEADAVGFTPGPWEYIQSNEHHGPYVTNMWGAGDICDCYAMTNPAALSVCNGGESRPIHHQYEHADANARLIAAAPEMFEELQRARIDIGILLAQLEYIEEATGEVLEAEDAAIIEQIAADYLGESDALRKAQGGQ